MISPQTKITQDGNSHTPIFKTRDEILPGCPWSRREHISRRRDMALLAVWVIRNYSENLVRLQELQEDTRASMPTCWRQIQPTSKLTHFRCGLTTRWHTKFMDTRQSNLKLSQTNLLSMLGHCSYNQFQCFSTTSCRGQLHDWCGLRKTKKVQHSSYDSGPRSNLATSPFCIQRKPLIIEKQQAA